VMDYGSPNFKSSDYQHENAGAFKDSSKKSAKSAYGMGAMIFCLIPIIPFYLCYSSIITPCINCCIEIKNNNERNRKEIEENNKLKEKTLEQEKKLKIEEEKMKNKLAEGLLKKESYKTELRIGVGCSANVYLVSKESRKYIMKIFKNGNDKEANQEEKALTSFDNENIVKFIESFEYDDG
jgi:hypothetical protein